MSNKMTGLPLIDTILVFDDRLGDAMSIEEYKSTFEKVLSQYEELEKEVGSLTISKIIGIFGNRSTFGLRYKNERKDTVVSAGTYALLRILVLEDTVSHFMGEKYVDVIRKYAEKTTQASIDAYIAKRKQSLADQKAHMEGIKKAMTDPQTLEDFKIYLESNKKSEMSLELLERYDAVILEYWKEVDAKAKAGPVVTLNEGDVVGYELKKTVHSRDGHDLFVIVLNDRVDRERYTELNSAAKKLGGWYSKYSQGNAIPGFQFKQEESAIAFGKVLEGGTESKPESSEPEKTGAQKLRQMGDEIIAKAEASLATERKSDTHRRATMAEHAEREARREIALGTTMHNIAEAIEHDEVYLLKKLNSRVLTEQLISLLRQAQTAFARAEGKKISESDTIKDPAMVRYARFPFPNLSNTRHGEVLREAAKNKADRKRIDQLAVAGEGWIRFEGHSSMDLFERLYTRVPANYLSTFEGEELKNARIKYQRMTKAGIRNESLLRSALRELIELISDTGEADPVKEMVRSLVGRKIPGFFPTPKSLRERILLEAEIEKGMLVCEPQGGKGDIADDIREGYGITPDVAEINYDLRELLKAKGHNVVASDFLELRDVAYDRIIMNPPFEDYADVLHIQHAYSLLKPGGRLVSIMASSAFQNEHKRAKDFRAWLDDKDVRFWKNPDGAFLESDRKTGVSTFMVVLNKPVETKAESDSLEHQRMVVAQGGSLLDMMSA